MNATDIITLTLSIWICGIFPAVAITGRMDDAALWPMLILIKLWKRLWFHISD